MIFYKDSNDLIDKILKYKRDDKLRRKIAKNGHRKYHKYFNSNLTARYIIYKTLGIKSKFYWEI